MRRSLLHAAAVVLLVCPVSRATDGYGIHVDPAGDAQIRRTDSGNDAPLPSGFKPIDLLEVRVQGWEPDYPQADPYTGEPSGGDEDLLRIQIVLDGLVAPPGPIGLDASLYNPYMFGARPLFGYIELDLDENKDTGGEFMPLAKNRYLANVGRFGMSPRGSISDRMVQNAAEDIDNSFGTSPQFERSGGEFTLALCGCFTPSIVSQNGNMDSIFDKGETWIVSGRFFERFVAFQPESGLFGGSDFGLFDPVVQLRFEHDQPLDQTTVTLVFPITNTGAAILSGGSAEPIDSNLFNQTSIAEALDDLIFGAGFTTGDLHDLAGDWDNRQIDDYYRPRDWGVSALIGTASTVQDPAALFVWTDTGFDETFGDLDQDGMSTVLDSQIILETIETLDGSQADADGIVNGEVAIFNYGPNFDLRDLNGDGIIGTGDIVHPVCPADLNGDGLLDFFDVSIFLVAFSSQQPPADFNNDGVFDFFDLSDYLVAFAAGCP